jgi:hypothetical protein
MISDLLIACNHFKACLETENQRGKQFESLIKNIQKEFSHITKLRDTSSFVTRHLTKLYKIHEILVGSYAKLYLSSRELSHLRSIYDGFFQTTLGLKRFPTKIKFLPTKITQEFCQGITFFKDQYERKAHPFYHRVSSCGTNSKTAQEKFSFKNSVKLCFLERAIYDQVYINLLHYQDLAHLKELRIMEQYYDTYFPNEVIIIKISFNDNDDSWPIELNLLTRNAATGKIMTEIYRKPYDFIRDTYKDEVHCIKFDNDKRYEKVQSYATNETSWIMV